MCAINVKDTYSTVEHAMLVTVILRTNTLDYLVALTSLYNKTLFRILTFVSVFPNVYQYERQHQNTENFPHNLFFICLQFYTQLHLRQLSNMVVASDRLADLFLFAVNFRQILYLVVAKIVTNFTTILIFTYNFNFQRITLI